MAIAAVRERPSALVAIYPIAGIVLAVVGILGIGSLRLLFNPERKVGLAQVITLTYVWLFVVAVIGLIRDPADFSPFPIFLALGTIALVGLYPDRKALLRLD